MFEAADLGVRLVAANARIGLAQLRCRSTRASLLARRCAASRSRPGCPVLIVFWLKPWLDRSLLFVLSRAVFGEPTRFADLWAARRAASGGALLARR